MEIRKFMDETYDSKIDNKISVKEIYEKFRIWIIQIYGGAYLNHYTKNKFYNDLKVIAAENNYGYIRYKEGYFIRGISYKIEEMSKNVICNNIKLNIITLQTEYNKVKEEENIDKQIVPLINNDTYKNNNDIKQILFPKITCNDSLNQKIQVGNETYHRLSSSVNLPKINPLQMPKAFISLK